jgi:hypothetical protein
MPPEEDTPAVSRERFNTLFVAAGSSVSCWLLKLVSSWAVVVSSATPACAETSTVSLAVTLRLKFAVEILFNSTSKFFNADRPKP